MKKQRSQRKPIPVAIDSPGDTNDYQEALIPLDLIDTEGQSVRDMIDDDHVAELAMSIARHGLLEPIVVAEKGDGRYQLLAGHCRLAAHYRLNRREIRASIKLNETAPVRAIALVENICRKDMSIEEEIKAVAYLHEVEKLSPAQICELTSKSRAWVDRRLAAQSLPRDVLDDLFAGSITLGHAEEIGRIEDEAARRYLMANTISAKLTVPQLRDLVETYLSNASFQTSVEAGVQKAKEVQATPPRLACWYCGEDMFAKPLVIMRVSPACEAEIVRILKKYHEERREETHGDQQ